MYTNYYDTAKVHVHSYKSTTITSTVCGHCAWSPLHRREELPLQREGHDIHNNFAVAILQNRNTIRHVPRGWCFLQKSGSEMTCIVNDNGKLVKHPRIVVHRRMEQLLCTTFIKMAAHTVDTMVPAIALNFLEMAELSLPQRRSSHLFHV